MYDRDEEKILLKAIDILQARLNKVRFFETSELEERSRQIRHPMPTTSNCPEPNLGRVPVQSSPHVVVRNSAADSGFTGNSSGQKA
jgi:hypothetical protein